MSLTKLSGYGIFSFVLFQYQTPQSDIKKLFLSVCLGLNCKFIFRLYFHMHILEALHMLEAAKEVDDMANS